MTRNEITNTGTGRVVSYEETVDERSERLRIAGEDAAKRFHMTPGQRRVLARVQDRARRQDEAV